MRVLVVDDEAAVVDELCGFLERHGHEVAAADSLEQACTALEGGGAFDVVVTDMRMTSGSGVDVVWACRRLAPQPAVVLMTGQASEADIVNALSAGVHSVLRKPLSMRDVMDTLIAVVAAPEPAAPARRPAS